ncbi:MAG: Hsp20/alpha crystallin family protein [Ferrimicrobium sp.]|jgi:HSP20 family protein|uniref:Hsp20/alpha crystallin family protein n=1 Tax=Ferrimicrobium sp. TaxID=2926050 RepID=UPI00260F8664|nr:Hsp20/alpha crystallin family protein [Ferrimicrobium sp.]MCL5973371.1 Hsp20/alpha crystallin family protein [Actinomycetota bacterium]
MMVMRIDPYREFDRMFQSLVQRDARSTMPVDAYRVNDSYVVQFDLPGINPEGLEVTVERNVLTVRARREVEHNDQEQMVVAERFSGTLERSIYLGSDLDAQGVVADYVDGVLTVTIPVHEAAKPRRIAVNHQPAKTAIAS